MSDPANDFPLEASAFVPAGLERPDGGSGYHDDILLTEIARAAIRGIHGDLLGTDLRTSARELKQDLSETRRELARAQRRLARFERSPWHRTIRVVRAGLGQLAPGVRDRVRRKRLAREQRTANQTLPPVPEPPSTSADALEFPTFDNPLVSVIIPVHGKWNYTRNCLRCLAERTTGVPYEVIVVDDASSDETPTELQSVVNARVVRNERNLGFVRSCNRGAAEASGRYLHFLNNDTEVREGWLSALVETAEADLRIGLVGSKLLYPDGRLQEAGGIVWRDGSAWNFGRLDRADLCQYEYVREVDYCSGASIMVRRQLFEAIQGFDVRYDPAYYEDTDLAFHVRDLGYKVIYQPRSTVVHYLGASHGQDLSQGIKRYQLVNRKKFAEKWSAVLERDHFPNGESVVAARDRRRGPRVLVVDQHVPSYDRDSGSLRMLWILRLLRQMGFLVTFLPHDMRRRDPYTSELQQMGIEVLYEPHDILAYLDDLGPRLAACIASRPDAAPLYLPVVRSVAPGAALVYDTVDLHYLREERRAAVEGSPEALKTAERYRRLETALIRYCDAAVATTETERALLQAAAPGTPTYCIPNVHPLRPTATPPERRSGVLFVGNFHHQPNLDAVRHFVDDIWPLVRRQISDATFSIVGSNMPKELKQLKQPGVVLAGWVPEITPFFEHARVFAAPLRYGAGLKGKIGEAMSRGVPVVTSKMGREGMEVTDGQELLVADDAESFAEAIVKLYRDSSLWASIREGGLRQVERTCSPPVVAERLEEMLRNLIPGWSPAREA